MNFLLDYFFPITTITPTPGASTAFLKQACVVVKPRVGLSGADVGKVHLCTTPAQVATYTTNVEPLELFNAGMSRVYIIPIETLNLASALLDQASNFFTLLISSDFEDLAITGNKAQGIMSGLKYTAKEVGAAGNLITRIYADTNTAGAASVVVTGFDVTISIEAGVTTNDTILAALLSSEPAMALFDVELDDTVENAGDETPIADPGQTLADGFDVPNYGTFDGVIGIYSNDRDFLATQSIIANRVAFYGSSTNKAKNMMFAFGKLLSNASDWLNQQFITMPYVDDVNNLGTANLLFDDKISFALNDDEFGSRLGLFAVGGAAIVAPYIVRNLKVDQQSAALSYVADNQPGYTLKHASLIEDRMQDVIDNKYIAREWITQGTATVTLINENFVATSDINIDEPKALWKINGTLRQSL